MTQALTSAHDVGGTDLVADVVEKVGQVGVETHHFTGPTSSRAWWRRRTLARFAAGVTAALSGECSPWGSHVEKVARLEGASIVAVLEPSGEIRWGAGFLEGDQTLAVEFAPGMTFEYDTRHRMAAKYGLTHRMLDASGLPVLRPA